MKTTELNFECTFNHSEDTVTCSWLGGNVKLVENFVLLKTFVVVSGNIMNTIDDISVKEFLNLQIECENAARVINKNQLNS